MNRGNDRGKRADFFHTQSGFLLRCAIEIFVVARLLASRNQTMSGLLSNKGFTMNVGGPSHRLSARWGNPHEPPMATDRFLEEIQG
jgi:hypothetical protein